MQYPHLCSIGSLRDATDLELLRLFFPNAAEVYATHNGSWQSIVHAQPVTARQRRLLASIEVARRVARDNLYASRAPLSSPAAVRDYLHMHYASCEEERFLVLFLDCQHRLIVAEETFRGTLTEIHVYPREVVRRALQLNAVALILAHNHPSGIAEPSAPDRNMTSTLSTALALVSVKVLDHCIVAGTGYVSFAERGWM